jgi:hypothetical protein
MDADYSSTPKTSRWLKYGAVLALVLLVYVYFKPRHVRVPAELIGTWETSNRMYADRSLEIGPESITFGTGPGTETTGFIEDVQSAPADGKVLYTISYSSDGTPGTISLYYATDDGETVRVKNQEQIVWKKKSD